MNENGIQIQIEYTIEQDSFENKEIN